MFFESKMISELLFLFLVSKKKSGTIAIDSVLFKEDKNLTN